MEILLVTDHKFIMPTCVAMKSLLVNNKGKISFHIVIDETVTFNDKKSLERIVNEYFPCKISFYNHDINESSLKKFPQIGSGHHTKATYYRLVICDILPKTLKKVLYIDDDVVVRKSLLPLWNLNIEETAIAVAPDGLEKNTDNYRRLGYDENLGYFNAGVMVINLDYWRENNIQNRFLNYIDEHSDRIVHVDQDVLNFTLRNDKAKIPLQFNVQTSYLCLPTHLKIDTGKYESEFEASIKDPAVIHYIGAKPWNRECTHPYRNVFIYYQNLTEWKGTPKTWFKKGYKHYLYHYLKKVLSLMGLRKSVYVALPHLSR